MSYEVVFEGEIRHTDLSPVPADEIEEWVKRITIDLMRLGAVTPAVAASTGEASVDIRVMVDNADADLALGIGGSQIRAACHAAGLGTPGWSVHWVGIYTEPGAKVPNDPSELVGAAP